VCGSEIERAVQHRRDDQSMSTEQRDLDVMVRIQPGFTEHRAWHAVPGRGLLVDQSNAHAARVSIAGHHGWAMVMGADPNHALAAAVVDAGLEAGHPNGARITAELQRLATSLEASVAADLQSVAATRVQFETF